MRRYVVAGGTGLVGSALCKALQARGDDVTILSRFGGVGTGGRVQWDGRTLGDWQQTLCGADGVVNLSGEPIVRSWRGDGWDRIRRSRIESTAVIAEAIERCAEKPSVWVNASAIGIYGDRGDEVLSEASPLGPEHNPLVALAKEWEAAAKAPGVPVAIPRIGIVLSRSGGSLPVLMRAAKSWIGAGRLGSGGQFISWIHLDDLVGLLLRALDDRWEGPFNAVSPSPVRQSEFMRALCRLLGRPSGPPAPAPLVWLGSKISGVPLHLALESQRVQPGRALEAGFTYRFPELMNALRAEISEE